MTNESKGTPLERLIYVHAVQYGGASNDDDCLDVSYGNNKYWTNTTVAGGSGRIWLYQTCSEFAFYQTCEVGSNCIFTQGLSTLASFTNVCEDAFGISPEQVAKRVDFTNNYFGADNPAGSRVFFVNGDIDPWHALGVLSAPTNADPVGSEPILMVRGASHHFWTHPSKPTDSPEIVQARKTIWNQVDEWLSE